MQELALKFAENIPMLGFIFGFLYLVYHFDDKAKQRKEKRINDLVDRNVTILAEKMAADKHWQYVRARYRTKFSDNPEINKDLTEMYFNEAAVSLSMEERAEEEVVNEAINEQSKKAF